jgi:inhibitor of cysteine peptidase
MQKLTDKFNAISVKKGDMFAVDLVANPSTGYDWNLEVTAGSASIVSREFLSSSGTGFRAVGASGMDRFIFRAEETGTVEISADYRRGRQKSAPSARSHQFRVNVS